MYTNIIQLTSPLLTKHYFDIAALRMRMRDQYDGAHAVTFDSRLQTLIEFYRLRTPLFSTPCRNKAFTIADTAVGFVWFGGSLIHVAIYTLYSTLIDDRNCQSGWQKGLVVNKNIALYIVKCACIHNICQTIVAWIGMEV